MAGLTETWLGADGSEIDTACIVTAEAATAFAAVSSRRPVLIPPSAFDLWLDPDERRAADAERLMNEGPPSLELVPIGFAVNTASNDDPSIQAAIGPSTLIGTPHRGSPQGTLF